MERTPRTILISLIGITFFVFILLFAYNRFGRYIDGPKITEINLESYQMIDEFSYLVQGQLENTAQMYIDNTEIILDQDQNFEKLIVLSPGHTIIEIEIIDPFEKVRRYEYTISTTGTDSIYFKKYQEAKESLTIEQETEITQETIN